jgi:hypothetical protein
MGVRKALSQPDYGACDLAQLNLQLNNFKPEIPV